MRHAALCARALAAAVALLCVGLIDGTHDLLRAEPALGADGETVILPAGRRAEVIPGRYIVVFRPGARADLIAARHGIRPATRYTRALNGFAANLSDAAVARLRADPAVALVEPDRIETVLDEVILPTGIDRVDTELNTTADIDGVDEPLDVDIAIIDTGIWTGHPDLRVAGGQGFLGPDCSSSPYEDDDGHRTMVAGVAAAKDDGINQPFAERQVVGVAPGARLWSLKVIDSEGQAELSCIITAIDWVTANAATIDVANMSLGIEPSAAMCQAIAASAAAGVVYAVSAGNDSIDARNQSPADCEDVITTSAVKDNNGQPGGLGPDICGVDGDDVFASFSNFGPWVELAAPGWCVTTSSVLYNGYYVFSGTSAAAPHVAGAAALDIIEHGKPTGVAGVAAVRNRLIALGASQDGPYGFTGDPDAFPEPLLYLRSGRTTEVAITGFEAPPYVLKGDPMSVTVTATVTNAGVASETVAVALTATGGAITGSPQTVTLGAGLFATLTFTWDASTLPAGSQTLTATVDTVPGDDNTLNNARSLTVPVTSTTTTKVSVGLGGDEANGETYFVRISADGRYVAFESYASNLVPGDTNAEKDVFVRDLQTGDTTRVSVDSAGVQANDASYVRSLSADGRYVLFESRATNLVPGETNGVYDAFVHDRQTGVTERVSLGNAGNELGAGGYDSYNSDLSDDGRFVLFTSGSGGVFPAI